MLGTPYLINSLHWLMLHSIPNALASSSVLHFKASNADEVYEAVKAFDWEQYLDTASTFSVDAVVYSEVFRHSKFVAYRVKDAIADYFNEKYGERPSVRLNNPDLVFHIHIAGEECTLALDSSGESLHRRGYRVETGRAPINEVLAAGKNAFGEFEKLRSQSCFRLKDAESIVNAGLSSGAVEYKYVSTCVGSIIAGLGGLSFIMDYLNGNWEYCIDAIGWLTIALVIFTVWKPDFAIIGSIIFGALYIASSYITGVSFASKEIFKMLPYVVTIIVLIFTSIRDKKENQPPEALGLPYFREER